MEFSRKTDGIAVLFFLVMEAFILINTIATDTLANAFWFCNHAPLLFAIGFYFRKYNFVKALINVGFMGQLLWIIDFLFRFTTGYFLVGVTDYVFTIGLTWVSFTSFLAHVFSTSVVLYLTYDMRPHKKIIWYSLVYAAVLLVITLLLSPPEENINCAFHLCVYEDFQIPFYQMLWIPVVFLFIILPTYAVQYGLWRWSRKRKEHL